MTNVITILAIESSADETACAIVQKKETEEIASVLAETTATSLLKHRETKGIVPEVAAREQLKLIQPVIAETFHKAQPARNATHNVAGGQHNNLTTQQLVSQLDAIAVTTQPGLIGSLLVGVETARTLASVWNLPLIPVNHVLAHPYANFVGEVTKSQSHKVTLLNTPQLTINNSSNKLNKKGFENWKLEIENSPTFPLLSLVISGGHTQLAYYESHHSQQVLGNTVDDAVGECLDKCARLLGGEYPGGPFIEKLATEWQSDKVPELQHIKLPRPLIHEDTFNVSFSGLKTAFARAFQESDQSESVKIQLAHELQQSISDVLLKKTAKALQQFPNVKSILISGGVSANSFFRQQFEHFCQSYGVQFHTPPSQFSTDNAVMIGTYALFHPELQTDWEKIQAQPF